MAYAFGGYGRIARYNADFATALESDSRIDDLLILPRTVDEHLALYK